MLNNEAAPLATRPVAGALAAMFAVVLAVGWGYPAEARLFPAIVGATGLVLSCWLLALREVRQAPRAMEQRGRMALGLLTPPVYSLAIWLAGFYPATLVLLIAMPVWLGFRPVWLLGPLAVVLLGVVYGLFSVAMDLPLPVGLLGSWLSGVSAAG